MTSAVPAGAFLLSTVRLAFEHDVVRARAGARAAAVRLGLDGQDQVRFATAVSELARNAFQYATGGRVELLVEHEHDRSLLVARVADDGPGIRDLDRILHGAFESSTGMGVGLTGARRLADRFEIDTGPSGTVVSAAKTIAPANVPRTERDAAGLAQALAASEPPSPFTELQQQNQELVRALDLLRAARADVDRLNQELAETNRGVVALYSELDDRAEQLRLMSETKTRFLSDVSHELRTPLSSLINLTRILLSHVDGPLSGEQEKQVSMMQRSAEWLAEMVNDLLDIAKIEAGKVDLRPDRFGVGELFAALRGMFRPLVTSDRVALVFEDPDAPLVLYSDEQRIAQILRNFVSNALKFTTEGEVRVSACPVGDDGVRFTVSDTGIGIAPDDQERIFEDYAQVDGPIQRRVRGTGLGLPLTRKLATLLGGVVSLESRPGVGSRFSVVIPRDVGAPEPAGG